MKDLLEWTITNYNIMYIEYWGQTTTSTDSMNLKESNPWKLSGQLKWKNNSRIQLNKTLQNTGIEKSVTLSICVFRVSNKSRRVTIFISCFCLYTHAIWRRKCVEWSAGLFQFNSLMITVAKHVLHLSAEVFPSRKFLKIK
jgi:hypothetical protein